MSIKFDIIDDEIDNGITVREYLDVVVDFLQYSYDTEIRESYSGRGMYGKECVGIVTYAPGIEVGVAFAEVAREFEIDFGVYEDYLLTRVDLMGLQTIYY